MTKELVDRFTGDEDGFRRLVDQLGRQPVVANDPALARALADACEVRAFEPGVTLITQDSGDTDLFMILVGVVSVQIQGREVAQRREGQHVGEMALIDPSQKRSASVVAAAPTVAAVVSESRFSELALQYPRMWRSLALELGHRLRQRGEQVRPRNDRPEVFVGSCSSDEGLSLARAIQSAHAHDNWVTRVWTDGTFTAGKTPIEALVAQLDRIDFALLVVTPDDLVQTASGTQPSPRDNVIFELGLAIGALGRDRAFMVKTRCKAEDLRLPSDLTGVAAFEVPPGDPSSLQARVGPATNEFRSIVNNLWSR